jgi:integrase/recombinase XerD
MGSGATVKEKFTTRLGVMGEGAQKVGSEGEIVKSREEKLARKLRPYHEKLYEMALRKVEGLPEGDRKLVLEFDRRLAAQGLSFGRRSAYLFCLVDLRGLLGKPFTEATRQDIERVLAELSSARSRRGERYSDWTLHNYRITLKRFYRWLLGNDEDYPDLVRWIRTTPKNNQLPRDSLLTNEEIEALVRACDNPRDRAIVLMLAESGVRAGELLSLRVGDVRFDQYGAIVTVRGKTGDRAVRLIASAPALATWLENHPKRDDPGAALWVNLGSKFKGTPLTYSGLQAIMRKLRAISGVKKRVHLHGFRHTAATRLARLLTEAEMKQYMGWVQSSRMASVYVHLASRDVDKSLLRIHGLITEAEDRERKFTAIQCPRCKQANSPATKFCVKCGLALSYEAAREADKRRELLEALVAKLKESPRFKELEEVLASLVEEALTK